MMRKITHIVVHCTATRQEAEVASILRYWRETKGWKSPGYHYIIDADGVETQLLTIAQPSNGVKGHNSSIINVCYLGGVDLFGRPVDNRTPKQKAQLLSRIKALKVMFPEAKIQGHRDFPGVSKACPSFDAKTEYLSIK
jgi:N-acetylmuramoyl-L-alanine amidase